MTTARPATFPFGKMTPQEAIDLLFNATGHLSANRETHAKFIEAANVLKEAIKPKEDKP